MGSLFSTFSVRRKINCEKQHYLLLLKVSPSNQEQGKDAEVHDELIQII